MSPTKRLISPIKLQHGVHSKKPKWLHEEDTLNSNDLKKEHLRLNTCEGIQDMLVKENADLDLSTWQRCLVRQVEYDRRRCSLILHVQAEAEQNEKENKVEALTCHLQGPWSQTRIVEGDLVSMVAVWDEQLKVYKVTKDEGFCVLQPDTLISSTSVTSSLFCARKTVLQERFRGVDANSKVMVIGSLVHELLQKVLATSLRTSEEINALAKKLLHSQENIYTLYASLMTMEETELEVQKFVPNILAFVEQYVEGKTPTAIPKDTFQGYMTQVQDIEENLWVPQLGLKGKIDVSVKVRRPHTANNSDISMPLELKTGRASFSMEHRGQLILYQMMLTATGHKTDSGLLLYLREGIMREIKGSRNEHRDLIMLRNSLSYYLSHFTKLPQSEIKLPNAELKFVQPVSLPEPISFYNACSGCAYATICCSFAKTDAELQLSDKHPLRKVMQEVTSHLQADDYGYFIHWCALQTLEEQEARKSQVIRAFWTETPETRQLHGRAIIDLILSESVTFEESRYVHTFREKNKEEQMDLTLSGFFVGEYVTVSSCEHLAVAAGFVCNITCDSISISLERNLLKKYAAESFIVDKHESQSIHIFNYTNLGLLLEDKPRAAALRDIIVRQQPPTFHKVLPKSVASKGVVILQQLNEGQRAAVLKALTTESYMLIKGLPGTGKTQTLVAIVRLLQQLGKSVLITSHTHSAVDNLLLRLLPYNLPILRLGSETRLHPELSACSENELTKEARTVEDLKRLYASRNIVGVTCLGAAHSIFLHRQFDYCIVDEATQVLQTTVLRPLFFCEKFILVGDPDQLPPVVRSREARTRGADESLFKRLDTPEATAVLTLQYRMNRTITKLANKLTYEGALQCGSKEVEQSALALNLSSVSPNANVCAAKWLQRALQTHVDQAVFLLDTLDCAERSQNFANTKCKRTSAVLEQCCTESEINPVTLSPSSRSKRVSHYINYCEAAVIFHILHTLLKSGYAADRIGVIAPYRAQVNLLRKLAAQHQTHFEAEELNFAGVEVNTVDQYQGRDKDIVLYSCTRTGAAAQPADLERARDAEILEDKRRLTVAITRSKVKLIIVGDAACLQQYTPFRLLLSHVPSYCKLQLQEGKLEFQWQTMFMQLAQVVKQ